jgi:uncharacterized protein (DUF433 family)
MDINIGKAVSAAEIAYLAGVPNVDAINRLVDEKVLPDALLDRNGGRRFALLAAFVASFYLDTNAYLTRDARIEFMSVLLHRVFERVGRPDFRDLISLNRSALSADFDWTVSHDALSVALKRYFEASVVRAERAEEAVKRVVENPNVQGGLPCFAGTRVPIATVLGAKESGMSMKELREAWPFLDKELLELAEIYVKTHPRVGRPKRVENAFPEAKLTSRKIVRSASEAK